MKNPFRTNHGLHLQQLDWTSKQVFGVSILTTQQQREVLYNSSKLNSGILHLLPNHFWRDGKLRSQNTYQQTNLAIRGSLKTIGITYSWGAPPALFQGSEIMQIKLRTVSSAVCHRTLEAKPMAKGRIKRTSRAIEKGGNLWLTTYKQGIKNSGHGWQLVDTADGNQKSGKLTNWGKVVDPIIYNLLDFCTSQVVSRISSINSMTQLRSMGWRLVDWLQ